MVEAAGARPHLSYIDSLSGRWCAQLYKAPRVRRLAETVELLQSCCLMPVNRRNVRLSGDAMSRLLANIHLALRVVAVLAVVVSAVSGISSAQTPAPEKIQQLMEILSDPTVKAWLAQQTQLQQPTVAEPAPAPDAQAMLSTGLTMIKSHSRALLEAFPRLPAQFERARIILLLEFEKRGILGVLALILGFVAAGFGLEKIGRAHV